MLVGAVVGPDPSRTIVVAVALLVAVAVATRIDSRGLAEYGLEYSAVAAGLRRRRCDRMIAVVGTVLYMLDRGRGQLSIGSGASGSLSQGFWASRRSR